MNMLFQKIRKKVLVACLVEPLFEACRAICTSEAISLGSNSSRVYN